MGYVPRTEASASQLSSPSSTCFSFPSFQFLALFSPASSRSPAKTGSLGSTDRLQSSPGFSIEPAELQQGIIPLDCSTVSGCGITACPWPCVYNHTEQRYRFDS